MIESEKILDKLILNAIRIWKGDCPITARDFDVTINHSPTDNLIIKTQALQYLLQCGIHPLIAMRTCGLWGDVEKTFIESKPYLDNLWKKIDDVEAEQHRADEAMQLFNNQVKNEAKQ